MDVALLIGRILLVVVFINAGIGKLTGLEGTAQYIASGAPMLPEPMILAVVAGLVELIGGILIVIGWQTRLFAVVMFVFVAIATYFFHQFWVDAGQLTNALKNFSMMGGFLVLLAAGAGSISIDGRRSRAATI